MASQINPSPLPSRVYSIVSYNLHGLNQGTPLLSSMCNEQELNVDCIFVQELWLTPANLYKIHNFASNYSFYGISAMEKAVSISILKGRPYGGVGILIKNELCQRINFQKLGDRFAAISCNNTLFVCIYLPTATTQLDVDIIIDTLAEIESIIAMFPRHKLICGGDLNVNLAVESRAAKIVNDFMINYDLELCTSVLSSNTNIINYTYHQDTLHQYSYIDYFMVSKSLIRFTVDFDIIDSAINLSDHNPIIIEVVDLFDELRASNPEMVSAGVRPVHYTLRWDHADTMQYYILTHEEIKPIHDRLTIAYDCLMSEGIHYDIGHADIHADVLKSIGFNDETGMCNMIDDMYERIVFCLKEAAHRTVPQRKQNFFKFWWNEEAEILKKNSISSHRLWCENGRPRNGPIYDSKAKAKLLYKSFLRQNKKNELSHVSNGLHEALLNKDNTAFWKMWNKKFCSNSASPNWINGSNDDHVIVQHFVNFFSIDNYSNADQNVQFADKFNTQHRSYIGDRFTLHSINIEMIDKIVTQLTRGKAAGIDTLTCEHLQFSHPIVISALTKLFNLMIMFNYVPNAFGKGIIIPIPKGDKRQCDKTELYRGITVSPVISKVFEKCMLLCLNKYLNSSDRQFGFKTGVGCNHAIHTVRKVIDHFTSNNSTVNLCTLDLSKAFDRINHRALFCKLMDRNVPVCFINLLYNWYNKVFAAVKWGKVISEFFQITTGVRQGGILSPFLFAIFVDDVLNKLAKSNLGCFLKTVCVNSIMYADDLVLLSISLRDMQAMVDMCLYEFNAIGMAINAKKSACLRIGNRHQIDVCPIVINCQPLLWKQEIGYLGILILSGKRFKINLQRLKQKYYRALNGIFGKVGLSTSPIVLCSLVQSHCIPILLYGAESLIWSDKMSNSFENAYSQAFMKIFKTFDKDIIKSCQFFMGYLPIKLLIGVRRLNYLSKLQVSKVNVVCDGLLLHDINVELFSICTKFNFTDIGIHCNWSNMMWSHFKSLLMDANILF